MIHLRDELRARLRSGESISKICREYELSFSALFEMLKRNDNDYLSRLSNCNDELYITERNGVFVLERDGVNYGIYSTVEDARKVKNYFIYNRWDKRNIDKVCNKLGVVRA